MSSFRGFPLLWLAATTSALGNGMRWVALPLLAVRETTDPWTISLVTAAEQAPWLIFGLAAGAVADRYDRRRLALWSDLLRALVMAAFTVAVVAGATPIAVIIVLGFLLTCGETVTSASMAAVIPQLVPPAGRPAANGRLQAGIQVTDSLIGSLAGAALFGLAAAAPFALDALTFAVSALCLGLLRVPQPVVTGRTGWTEGVRFVWNSRLLRGLCLLQAVLNTAFAGVLAIFVLFTGQVLGLDATGFGLLVAVFAVGGIGGGLLAGRLAARYGTRRCLLIASTGSALSIALVGVAQTPVQAGAAGFLLGAAYTVAGALTAALRQNLAPDALAGRVTSAFRLAGFGAGLIGALAAGALASAWGLRAPFVATGVLVVAAIPACRRMIQAATASQPSPNLQA
ncbi:MAG TPA: MFS transporter [Actinoplanes sp.]|nr:MFS transporter [Actinoplanes sp.]